MHITELHAELHSELRLKVCFCQYYWLCKIIVESFSISLAIMFIIHLFIILLHLEVNKCG